MATNDEMYVTPAGIIHVDAAMHAAARVIEQIQFGVFPGWDNVVAARHWMRQYLANYPQPVLSHLGYINNIDPNEPTPNLDKIYPRWSIQAYQHKHVWESEIRFENVSIPGQYVYALGCVCGELKTIRSGLYDTSYPYFDGDWSWCANPGQPALTWHNAIILASRATSAALLRDQYRWTDPCWRWSNMTQFYFDLPVDNPLTGANLNS